MQLAVAATFSDQVNLDPLAESESLECFRGFLSELGVPEDAASVTLGLLSARQFVAVARVKNPAPQVMDQLEELEVVDVVDDGFPPEDPEPKPDKRRKAENTLVQQLGTDPKKVRFDARASLQPEYYASISGKKDTLILHRLGACFRVLGVDYLRFRYVGDERSAACARRRASTTKPKVVRATLRQARRLMI